MEHNQNSLAPEAATDEPASPVNPGSRDPAPAPDILDFDPAPLRYRTDGLTPQRQREFVEALADCGVARQAAARIGLSEQAINRVRRRADARGFDLACEAAQRIGARSLRSVAWERAIEGTVKRHYYHGELKSEEVVYDNRLLVYLLGKTAHLVEPPAETQAVIDNWEPWMEAIEQGLPEPPPPEAEPEPQAEPEEGADPTELPATERYFEVSDDEVWEEDDGSGWWTTFPPPADFEEMGSELWGEEGYLRPLSEAEERAVTRARDAERLEKLREEIARRDWYFGFAGGNDEVGYIERDLAAAEREEADETEEPERDWPDPASEAPTEDDEDDEAPEAAEAADNDEDADEAEEAEEAGEALPSTEVSQPMEAETHETSEEPAGVSPPEAQDEEEDSGSGPRRRAEPRITML